MNTEVKEVVYELLGIDVRTIWSSVKNLTIRPGVTIRRFCDGETGFLLSPGTYFFGVMTMIYFLSSVSGFEDRLQSQVQQQIIQRISLTSDLYKKKIAEGAANLSSRFGNGIAEFIENDTVLKFFAVPMLLLCRWLLFRGHIKSFKANSWYSLFTIASHDFNLFTIGSISHFGNK